MRISDWSSDVCSSDLSSDLLSKWYGESEQQIARLFARARQVAPTVIFIDELDSLVPARGGGLGERQVTERVVNTILAAMDGLEELPSVRSEEHTSEHQSPMCNSYAVFCLTNNKHKKPH